MNLSNASLSAATSKQATMSNLPHHFQNPFSPTAVPRKRPADPPAAMMRQPLGDRPVWNANVLASDHGSEGKHVALAKPAVPHQFQQQQRPYATPNMKATVAVARVDTGVANKLQPQEAAHPTPAATSNSGLPFKSPTTLCFERMLGAGK